MEDLIRRSDAIKSVLGITMYQDRVPIDTVIFQINNIAAVEPCKDVISRETLIRTFVEDNSIGYCGEFTDGSDCAFTSREVIETIQNATAVAIEICEDTISRKWLEDKARCCYSSPSYDDSIYAVPLTDVWNAPSVMSKPKQEEMLIGTSVLTAERE